MMTGLPQTCQTWMSRPKSEACLDIHVSTSAVSHWFDRPETKTRCAVGVKISFMKGVRNEHRHI